MPQRIGKHGSQHVCEVEAARDSGYLVLRPVISDVGRHPGPSPVQLCGPTVTWSRLAHGRDRDKGPNGPPHLIDISCTAASCGRSHLHERPLPRAFVLVTDGDPPWDTRNCLLYTSPSPRDGLLSRMP